MCCKHGACGWKLRVSSLDVVHGSIDSRAAYLLPLLVILSIALRLPILTWPIGQAAHASCCGNIDEITHYNNLKGFTTGKPASWYPTSFAFLTYAAERVGAARLADRLIAQKSDVPPDRSRDVIAARLVSIAFSCAAIFLMFRLALLARLGPMSALAAAAFLGLSPLFLVQTTYGTADGATLAFVMAYVYAFVAWSEKRSVGWALAFGLAMGAALVIKGSILIALPLAVCMVAWSANRVATAAAMLAAAFTAVAGLSGMSLGFAHPRVLYQLVVENNMRTAKFSVFENSLHYAGSVVPSLGVLFSLLLLISIVAYGRRLARDHPRWKGAVGSPWTIVAVGCGLHFVGVCFLSNPFVRHLLPLHPFLILFALRELGVVAASVHFGQRMRLLAVLSVIAYEASISWPIVRSFGDDPMSQASRWLQAETGLRLPPTDGLNLPPREHGGVLVVHSWWSGRVTGRWWLKPSPRSLDEAYHFRGSAADFELWRRVLGGQSKEWRVIWSSGEDWNTPERWFLTWLGKGYDQGVTAGRVEIFARRITPGQTAAPPLP